MSVDRHKLIGHLMELWWWAIDNVGVDGRLTEMTHKEIAEAAQWEDDPQKFLEALIGGGFIDKTSDGLFLHDWYDYAGKLIEAREKERERSRERRKATSGRPADNQRSTVGTVPDPTVPDPTVPNPIKQEQEIISILNHKLITSDVSEAETQHNEVSDAKTPQSKVKERKGNKKKSTEDKKRDEMVETLFEKQFWPNYPRRDAKVNAFQAFKKVFDYPVPSEQCNERFRNMGIRIAQLIAEKRDRKHIPLPATFLNREDFDSTPDPIETDEIEFVEVEE